MPGGLPAAYDGMNAAPPHGGQGYTPEFGTVGVLRNPGHAVSFYAVELTSSECPQMQTKLTIAGFLAESFPTEPQR